MRNLALLVLAGWAQLGCSDDVPVANADAGGDASMSTDAGVLQDAGEADSGLSTDLGLGPDGGEDSGSDADAADPDSGVADGGASVLDLFPLRVGAVWTYAITDANGAASGTKTQTAVRTTTLPNVVGDVFELETLKPSGETTVSYQQDTGPDIIRFREDNFDAQSTPTGGEVYTPYKLRVPKGLITVGATRTETFQEQTLDALGAVVSDTSKTVQWTVEAVESVTVPAGTFGSAIRMRRSTLGSQSDKSFWFVDGVGKVKEVGLGQTEELSSFSIP